MNASLRPCFSPIASILRSRIVGLFQRTMVAIVALPILGTCTTQALASPQATTTTLAITSAGSPVSTVVPKTVVTLTATVMAGSTPVTPGTVNFCDTSALSCTDMHLIGTAQLTSAGIATVSFRPALGTHSYKAVFAGTNAFAASSSAASSLAMPVAMSMSLTSTGAAGGYGLSDAVNVPGGLAPTGPITFQDITNGNYALGIAALTLQSIQQSYNATGTLATVGGGNISQIVTADLNQDGIPDVVVPGGNVQVFLGNGDGTFTAAATISAVSSASAVAVGDFNSDGKPDLAVVSNNSNSVTILLGNGDGTFTQPGASLATGNGPVRVAVGDFNGDGNLDLAVTNSSDNTITILLGKGDGTFSPTTAVSTPAWPSDIISGDFNGDGKIDLAISNTYYASGCVNVFLGSGDGTFTSTPRPISSGTNSCYSVAAADVNHDGNLDLLATDFDQRVTWVLLGTGNGAFSVKGQIQIANFNSSLPTSVAVGDLNGDGIVDFAMSGIGTGLTIAAGKGDGTFTATPIATSVSYGGVAVADFNGDGIADAAVRGGNTTIYTSGISETYLASRSLVSPVGVGTHQVHAVYVGDSTYSPATSNTVSLTAQPATTTVSLTTSPPSGSNYGQQVVLTAILSPYTAQGYSTNGETVTFYNGATAVGTGVLSGGVATLNITSFPVGINSVTAVYGGDTNFAASASNALAFDVLPPRFVVNTNADDSGTAANCASGSSAPCSLRDALTAAQSNGGIIIFDPTVFNATNTLAQNTITLGSTGTLTIPANTTITGATSGSGTTLTNLVTVSGNNTYGVFSVASSVTGAILSNLTITRGKGNAGGAVNNAGSLTVNQCTFSGNTASQGYGGAIENSGQLNVNGSTFTTNNAFAAGGAIDNASNLPLTVNNSTFTANTGGQGSAIYNGQTLTMNNSTISGNSGSGAIFNNGLATGSNNILSGDTGGECAGIGCLNDAYFLVAGVEQQIGGAWDSGTITLGWPGGSYTVHYGQFSTPASISSTFGGGISNSGWPGGAEGFGSYFVLGASGSFVAPVTITNTSKSFTVTQVYQSLLSSSNGNIVGTAGNLSPLGNYGGPTQTMIPLPGSSAICAGLASGLAPGVSTDQRGFANTNTSYTGYSSNHPCVDAGSVQTDYALSFNSQPPASVTAVVPFTAAVTLDESGKIFTAGSAAIPLTLTGNGSLLNGSASTANGIATYPSLSVSLPGANDKLNANLTLNGTLSITTPSNSFTVIDTSTTTAATSQTVTFSPGAQGITLTAQVFSSLGIVNAGTVTFTVVQGTTLIGSAATSATVSNGHASAVYSLPGGTAAGAYSIQAVYNAGGAFASSSDNTQTITIRQATPVVGWPTPAAITYGTAIGGMQLNATASTGGTFTYTPASGLVLPAGPQTLSATFTPTDATNYSTPPTATVTLNVNKAPLAIGVNNAARVVGAANPIFTGTVAGAVNGDAFTESFSTAATAASIVGSYPIVPSVSGINLADYSVTPTNGALTISQAGTSTTFALSNSNLTLTANVVSLTSGTPTGSVGFYEGQTLVGTGTLTNGVATYTTASFPAGNVVVSAQYSGDANFTESESSPILMLSVTPAQTSITVSQAGSVTDALSLSVASGFSGTLQLSCMGLPQGAACSFQPSSITFTGTNNAANTTLTVQTGMSASAVASPLYPFNGHNLTALAGLFGLPSLALLGFTWKTRRLHPRIHLLLILLMLGCTCAGLTACGSTAPTLPQSPTGTSTVQVIASDSSGFSQTTSLNLTVQ